MIPAIRPAPSEPDRLTPHPLHPDPLHILHKFVQVGQYMADRKGQLAAAHVAQVQRLIAEGRVIAAQAQRNR
jgi:hypothetical protein